MSSFKKLVQDTTAVLDSWNFGFGDSSGPCLSLLLNQEHFHLNPFKDLRQNTTKILHCWNYGFGVGSGVGSDPLQTLP